MQQILTVTLNPALDVTTSVEAVVAGRKLRCEVPRVEPGGGGVNVSRAISKLGRDSLAFAAVGGAVGAEFRERLENEGVVCKWFDAGAPTRQSFAVHDRQTEAQYRFVLPGPEWSEDLWQDCLLRLRPLLATQTVAVISGSLPPGVPVDAHCRIAGLRQAAGCRLIVDTSGLALAHLAGVGGTGIDTLIMDEFEAGRLFAVGNIDAVEASGRAGLLVRRGVARTVVITLGGHGAVAATVEGAWQVTPPEVRVESAVGAGDSFVAAFAIASAEGRTLAGTMRYAMGAATSAVTTPGTELCTREGTETYSRLATCAPLVPPDRC